MTGTAKWIGYGWYRPPIGRVKLNKSAPFYRGRWVELMEIDEDGARVFIQPAERSIRHEEIERLELS